MADKSKTKSLIQEANEALKAARDMKTDFADESGAIPADKQAELDLALEKAMELKEKADAAVQADERERKFDELETFQKSSAGRLRGMSQGGSPEGGDGGDAVRSVRYKSVDGQVKSYTPTGNRHFTAQEEIAYTDDFRQFLIGGFDSLSPDQQLRASKKSLSVGSDGGGGIMVASEVFSTEIIEELEDIVMMRRLGRVLPPLTQATSLKIRAIDADMDDAEWTSEVEIATADSAEPFGGRALHPHPLMKVVLASTTFLRLANMSGEAYVRREAANRLGAAEESAFMTGDGAQKPEGVFTSSRPSVVVANSATDIDYADLVETEFAVKAQYRRNASWIMHRTILKELHLLTDGNDRSLLREIPAAGARFSLMGYPVNETEYAPSSSATGLDVLALGNWGRAYYIVDSLVLEVQVLKELYAGSRQVGYYFTKEVDGMVVDGNGIAKLQMA